MTPSRQIVQIPMLHSYSAEISHPHEIPGTGSAFRDVPRREAVEISIVAPVFNEEAGLEAFAEAVTSQLEQITDSWEILFVDDGSSDRSPEVLQALHARDKRIKVLRFSRNFGNQAAASAGLKFSCGNAVIVMDSDLQHPPELIPEMVRLWKEGYHSVYTIRSYGNETGTLKRRTSAMFSKMMNHFSRLSMPEGLSDFRLLDRKIVDYINTMEESSRFLRAMIAWLGFRQIGIPFATKPRFAGKTKFSPGKLLKLSIDGITSFSVSPLRWITYFGLFVAMVSILYAGYVLYEVFTSG
ncbi:MAG: glycosyltransferase family 2 protein, partial [Planctomycetaceae bacterium]|nr:glycosyltransferase family 2 protein [Planctomycetaceae bacterium]